MSLVSKDDLRGMTQRLVPRIAPKETAKSSDQLVAEKKLQDEARRLLKEMTG